MTFPEDLIAGDILLYASPPSDPNLIDRIVDGVIEVKEGDDVAHIEIYVGNGLSWASRNGVGVNEYPFRPDGLKYVRRVNGIFDSQAAKEWFEAGVKGMKYGFGDILASVRPDADGQSSPDIATLNGVDCSHFAAALLETALCPQFDRSYPKNKITPRDFKLSAESLQIFPQRLQ